MTDDELSHALIGWTDELYMAALREGWSIFDSDSEVQVQRINDPDQWMTDFVVPLLDSDDVALLMVRTGTGEHHRVASLIIATHNPAEFERMNYLTSKVEGV